MGICVGMQLFSSFGEEDGGSKGFDWIKGKVNKYNKRGETVHLAIKIEHSHREISPITNNDINIEELIKKRPSKYGDLWKLTQRFNSLKTLSILQA